MGILKKLFKSNLEVFLVKRLVLMFFLILPIIFFVKTGKTYVLCGLTVGAMYSCFRLRIMAGFYGKLFGKEVGNNVVSRSMVNYLLSQAFLLLILVAAIRFNIVFFASIIVGVLILPFVIMLNSITEVFGITHNNFE